MHQIRCKKKECEISDQLRVTRNNFKNSFSCLLDIVTCDRGVGRRTPFIRNKGCDNIFVTALIANKSHSGFLSAHKMYSVNSFKLFTQRLAPACWNLRATDCFKRSFPPSLFVGMHHMKVPSANYLQSHQL